MIPNEYLVLVFGMGIVTYLPRWLPLFFLSRRNLSRIVVEWLDLIPAAILSALLAPALVTAGEPKHMSLFQPELWVGIPTLAFALKTKSLGGTVIVGMLLFWLVGKIF